MHLLRTTEFEPAADQAVFRQNRVTGTIGISVLVLLCVAAGPVVWYLGAPWFIWIPCAAVAILPLLLFPNFISALYAKSNWVVAVDKKAVWINLRSPFNRHFPEGCTVLRLELAEIVEASLHGEKYSTPDPERGSRTQSTTSLQFKLGHAQTETLVEALQEERNQKPIAGKGTSMRAHHYPVSVPEPDVIRINWHGSTMEDRVTPNASKALQILNAAGVPTREPAFKERGHWRTLSEPELNALVRDLALSGKSMDAIRLLRKRKGLSLADAMRQVDEITKTNR